MRRSSRITLFFIACFFMVFASGCATYRTHPEFKARQKLIQKVAVLPPDVEIVKVTFKGEDEPMYDVIAVATKQSKEEIEAVFKKKEYQVQELRLTEEDLKKQPELRTTLFHVRELYKKALDDISKRKQRKFLYSLGADVNPFADLADADVLVMVRMDGFKKTKGEITKDFVKSMLISVATFGGVNIQYTNHAAVIQVGVVDGNTGETLWFNTNAGSANIDPAKENELRSAVRNLVKAFPKRAQPK